MFKYISNLFGILYTKRPNEYQKLQSEIRKNIYDIFQKHGLNLTFPQVQIDIVKNNLDSKAKNLQQEFNKKIYI